MQKLRETKNSDAGEIFFLNKLVDECLKAVVGEGNHTIILSVIQKKKLEANFKVVPIKEKARTDLQNKLPLLSRATGKRETVPSRTILIKNFKLNNNFRFV